MRTKSLSPIATAIAIAATLVSVTQAAQTNLWETTAAAGLALTRGNSETLLATISLNSKRKTALDEVLLGVSGTYGEDTAEDSVTGKDKTETTAQTLAAFGQYNRSLTDRWYAGFRTDFLHDHIADLSYRFTLSPLVGYYAIKRPATSLKFEAGPSGIFEKQGDEQNNYAALRFGERFEHAFTPKAKMWQSLDFIPQVDRFENYLILAEIGAEASLTEKLSLRAVLQDIYDNEPAEDRKKNDLKLITSLAYKF